MDFRIIVDSIPLLWQGFQITLELFVITSVCALVAAVPVSILQVSANKAVRTSLAWTSRFLRGTPLLVQLFIIYFGLSQVDFIRESWAWAYLRKPYWCALIAFVLNSTAYNAHVLRGAILSVPHGDIEAGRAFGMSSFKLYRYIILPSAFRIALPGLGNELIKNLKRTAIASTITIGELTGTANLLVARTLAPYEIFITAAIFYLVLTFIITRVVQWLEVRLQIGRHPLLTTP
jgi:His/Glu/Gln/Arg/opine family amino acid ABC transporter permease subunit